ncbi:GNAT family N-acetyltransferase [Aeromonas sp. BIGb0445]|uniref:GNAT family N-acetyltransferase n=1 Tax=Aeromonas sp. BIGb0445 TaxID=2940593 RepID=UPI00216838E8|nr:N-acetyltransferase [Aeromonas sp. BIGb0445]MCS3459931.1 ribosomal protein S18 acetylase RimI-like enzyme [Aeromonas sp. BIGb0445]
MSIQIRPITPEDWPQIMAIQAECYRQLAPEPLSVMRNKAELAPQCCWVGEIKGAVLGYLLCHPWHAHQPPSLSVPMAALTGDEEFYLHDLAVSTRARGLGLGQALLDQALRHASHSGYARLGLVAVQDAPAFWLRQGFAPAQSRKSLAEYGDGALYMERLLDQACQPTLA